MHPRFLLLAFLLLLPACVTHRTFAPRENATATAPNGMPAANYPLADSLGPCGEVRLWADGDVEEVDGEKAAVVRIGIELENRSQKALRIDAEGVRLQDARTGRDGKTSGRLLRATGTPEVQPGHSTVMTFHFAVDGVAKARSLLGFEVRWLVRGDSDDKGFEQVTPFGVFLPPPDPWYDGPYWGPGWYGYGYGYGWYGPWGPHHHFR